MTRKAKSLEDALKNLIPEELLGYVPRAFDTIGDIIVLKIPEELEGHEREIGRAFCEAYPYIKTVLNQTGPVEGEFRTRPLELLYGKDKRATLYKEHGCVFKVDLDKAYFSPRLATERGRIRDMVEEGEKILNMFAGIGTFSIVIARYKKVEIYSVDKNPNAYNLMIENIGMNKLKGEVKPVLGDARDFVREGYFDRVLMPLPERAEEFLDVAAINARHGGRIHYHIFCRDFGEVEENLSRLKVRYEIEEKRVVRSYAPGVYHVVFDMVIMK
ncbi:MAG: class I SAM-dependent methyltransferase family protein [Candidatus Hydrothermarchaeales archaeon]